MILYGIPNCDTTKKAMYWLKKNNINFDFHNYKERGISAKKLNEWCDKEGWEKILNKRSTTWRELSPAQQQLVTNQQHAVAVMVGNNSIIKRPIIEYKNQLLTGFDEKKYTGILKK
ncbi:MAG: Spx/MgsR family RNA polymerase-binding regulatory protein [Chitinophagaceae bacterium]|nr:Spx/MgsR family RNA polymerase-binding regulatory protein [Chitinophagaceae bacterium]